LFWANVVIEPIRDNAGLLIGFSKVTRDNTERRTAETKLLASEARYRALADALPQIVWVMRAEDGEATYVNRQFEAYYGSIGTSATARLARNHPSDAERMESAWHAVRGGQAVDFEGRLLRHDGVYRWHKLVIVPVRRERDIVEWFGTALDIDDIVTARNKLEETTDLLRLAQEAAGAGVWEWELGPGIVRLSPQSAAMHGIECASSMSQDAQVEMTVKNWEAYVHPDDLVHVFDEATRAIEQRNIFSAEFRVAYPGSEVADYRWLQSFGRILFDPDSNEPIRVVGLDLDITDRKKAERQIAHMAVHDALTGLPNRVLFRDRLEHEIASSKRSGRTFAVLACDLDGFKVVNDTLGHPAGDTLLGIVAERLRSVVRHGDTVARLGGDEFAIILGRLEHLQEASVLAQRVIETVGQSADLDGRPTNVGISIGIAAGPVDGTNANDLFKHADLALYRAKMAGRNTYRFYEAGMDAAIAARNLLQLDMREALNQRGFVLHYQPIINLASNVTAGFEALLRWHHPARGEISPAEFIPLAEETGLIVSLGDWALREACRDAASWPDHMRIAVNVSAVQFQQPGLEQSVLRALATSGLRANRLELEITESVLLADAEAVTASLHRLRALGVRIALDDFGTGYSSLSYLRKFPFDKIKIDRSFIHEIADPDTAAIVRAVVGLGARLGTAITAEGVESNEQLELARQEGCTEAQGFLFSRPLPAVEALNFACSGHSRAAA
jgi:diguanylate cyclase (GGDEF)-like protein/PAS domain S-box-containing protein